MRTKYLKFSIAAALFVAACEKRTSPPGDTQPPNDATPTNVSVASAAALAGTAPPAMARDAAVITPRASADPGKAGHGGGASARKLVSKHVGGKNFTLDLASVGCSAASECIMTIKLVATGEYHVNREYPYKFMASPAPDVEFLGKGDVMAFTRAAGDFVEKDERIGTMTVRFKPASAGEARVAGIYKFSVCSADQCQIEQEKIELTVPVM